MKIIVKIIDYRMSESEFSESLDLIKDMDRERYEHICKIKSEANRMRSLSAGLLIKEMCDRLDVKDARILRDDHGKPYLEGHSELFFNLSHSGEYVALAYGDDPVGIDIQEVRNVPDSFAQRILNEKEYDLYDLSDTKAICRVWTIKEAYSKLIGLGLGYDFRNCMISKDDAGICDITGTYNDASYRTHRVGNDVYMTYVRFKDTKNGGKS